MPSPELSEEFRPGAMLAGKYRVERVLGAGGMGVVCLATHVELEQQVALKFLLPGAVDNTDRFMREARAAARLKSEHVVRVLDVAKTSEGRPYMVLEYLEGDDLDRVLEKNGALPLETAADYLVQACEGLAEAHARGIVHRDLKPQNLFLTRGPGGEPLVKILDFGIAKMTDGAFDKDLTQTSSVMGSPVYMSPEQMRSGRDAVIASDVWSLGVIFQELLTKQVPFDGDSMPELCLKVVAGAPRSPLQDVPSLPKAVVDLIARCLEKEPAQRFNDAGEVAEALRPFVSEAMLPVAERAVQLTEGRRIDGAAPVPYSRQSLPASLPPAVSGAPPLFLDDPTLRTRGKPGEVPPVRSPEASSPVLVQTAPVDLKPIAALGAFALVLLLAYALLRGGQTPSAVVPPSAATSALVPTAPASAEQPAPTAVAVAPSSAASTAEAASSGSPSVTAPASSASGTKARPKPPGASSSAPTGTAPPVATKPPPSDEIPDLR